MGVLLVGWLSTTTKALTVGGQAYYAFLGNISLLGIPLPLNFGPLPIVNLPPTGGVVDDGLPSINVGVPIIGPTVFSVGAVQVHAEGDTTANTVLSRATSGQFDLFPVPIIGTTGLLRAAGLELECSLGPTGFTSHAAVAGIESSLLPAGALPTGLWADPPPNTGLTITGLGSVFLHETTKAQVGNLTVFTANGVRIELDTTLIPLGGATGELIWGHVECAAERPIPTTVSPTSGAPGTVVTITGTGFRADSTVDFAGIPAASVTFVSATELTATVPPMLGGTWNVSVTTPVDRGTVVNAFTTMASPPGLPSDNFTAQAFGVQASLTPALIFGPITFGPRPAATLPAGGGIATDTLLDIPALPGGELVPGGLLTAGVLETRVQGSPAAPSLLAQNTVAGVSVAGGLIAATGVDVRCELGPTGLTGGTTLAGVSSTLGISIPVNPPPNFGISIPPLGTALLNEQIETVDPVTGRRTLVVNAVHVSANLIAIAGDLIIGHAECSVQPPTVTSVTPNTGPVTGGTMVTLAGLGFGGTPTVTFGGTPATAVTVVNGTTLTAVTPAHAAGPVDVVVTMPTGSFTLPAGFTYTAPAAPTVTGVTPATGSEAGGTPVTIAGTGLTGATAVTFGGVPATSVTPVSDTSVTAVTPAHAPGPVDVVVTTPGGDGTLPGGFTYTAGTAPTVTSVAPNTGPETGGTAVTITGTGLTGATGVTFGGVPATAVTPVSDTSVTATTPAHAVGPVDVVVTTPGGAGTLPGGFTYTSGTAPTVTTATPNTGPETGGTVVTITGTDLTGATVTFGGTPATSVTPGSATSITATTPPHAPGVVDIVVTTPAGSGTLTGGFTYTPVSDVTVTVTGPSTASPGAPLVYTVTVTNNGSIPATGTTVDFPLPPGLTFVSNAGACTSAFPCALGTVDPGTSQVITTTLQVPADYAGPNPIVGTITVASPDDASPGNNTFTVQTPVVPSSDIGITMTADNLTPNNGQNVTFTITVHNFGPLDATGVQVVDQLPAGLTLVSNTPSGGTYDPATGIWNVGPIANGADATLQLVGTVTQTGPIVNTATRTGGDQFDPDPSDNTAAVALNAGPTADVRLSMTSSITSGPVGAPVTFTLTAENIGPNNATGVVVRDLLPAGLTFTSATPSVGTYDQATGDWTIGAIPNGTSVSLALVAVIGVATPVTNTAQKTAQTEFDPAAASDTAGVTINGESSDLQLIMTQSPSPAPPGSTVTVTLILTNLGPSTATGVDVHPAIPGGLIFVSAAPPAGTTFNPATNTWDVGTMPAAGPGSTQTLTIVGVVPETGGNTTVPRAQGDQPDPNPTNNSPSTPLVFSTGVDLAAAISMTGDLAAAGSPATFTLTARNVGTGTSAGPISALLALPPSLTITGAAPAGWTCATVDTVYTCVRADLALGPGQATTLTVNATVGAGGTNDQPRTLTVVYVGDTNLANNVASLPSPVPPGAETSDLSITQDAVEAPPGTVTYTIRVTNRGPAPAPEVRISDLLPVQATLVSATAEGGSCTGTTTVVCNLGTVDPNQTKQAVIVVTLPQAGAVTNAVVVTSGNPDPDASNSISILTTIIQGSLVVDTDGDGMPDVNEDQFGTDPNRPDADEDPDGDGVNSGDEIDNGTHPRGFFKQIFAEGANGVFFDTEFSIVNASTGKARTQIRLNLENGRVESQVFALDALKRRTLGADAVLGAVEGSFAAIVEADNAIGVQRLMTWDNSSYGSTLETGSSNLSTTWFFAEGATHGGFHLYYLLANPSMTAAANVTATFLPSRGGPVTQNYTIPPHSRLTLLADSVPGLAVAEIGARFTSDIPIVAERAMYLNNSNRLFEAGSVAAGATATSNNWTIAEGATGGFFDCFLLLANPNNAVSDVTATYLLPNGDTRTKQYSVAANSRLTINVALEDPVLAARSMSISLSSTLPIVAERAMWWPGEQGGHVWYEGHASFGSTTTAARWAVASGADGGPAGDMTFVLIANHGTASASVNVTVIYDDGTSTTKVVTVPGTSRTTLNIGLDVPEAANKRFSLIVGATGSPLTVDVSRYRSTTDQFWSAGASSLGTTVP